MLPNSLETEQSLIGAFLIDNETIDNFFLEGGELEYFYNIDTYNLAKGIYEMILDGLKVDLVTVKGYLGDKCDTAFMVECTDICPLSANWKDYYTKLRELYQRRELITSAKKLEKSGFHSEDYEAEYESIIDSVNKSLSSSSKSTTMETNISKLKSHIDENKGKELIGYSWGIPWLDRYTRGIRKGKTYRIGAPSGIGKTNLAYQTINSLLSQNAKVLFVSLENSIETTYIKMLSTVQNCNPNMIEIGKVKPDYSYLEKNKDNFILTDQLFNIGEIKREVLRVKPDVVILDYIGLVDMKANEKEKYDKYADEIKEFIQKNQEISWIDLSNLNKDDDEDRIRIHKGFNGSAKLRNNADVTIHMFYHKPFYDYKNDVLKIGDSNAKNKFLSTQVITFLLSKNRLGVDGVEENFMINFSNGIKYEQVPEEEKEKWKSLTL